MHFLAEEHLNFSKRTVLERLLTSYARDSKNEKIQVVDLAGRGAPKIIRYFCLSDIGYGFTLVDNLETDISYEETVDYPKFENLELMAPYQDGHDMHVAPQTSKIVILR